MNMNIAKTVLITAAIVASLASSARAASPGAETTFVAEVRAAFAAKDPAKLLSLVYWDRVDANLKRSIEQQFSNLMKLAPAKIELSAPDPGQRYEYSHGGTSYRTNLPVTKQLRIEFKPGNVFNTTEMTMPVGEKDGKVFITTAVPVK